MNLSPADIKKSYNRIQNHITKTPILTNQILNQKLGAEIYFKCENFQITGSFKLRGAINKILKYKEENGFFPQKIVAISSGNHAQAIAYLAKEFGVKALIYMDKNVSSYKIKIAKNYGAKVILTKTKKETGILAQKKIEEGYLYIHPSNDDDIICGQGTACLEAIEQIGNDIDAVFAPCGGGGLIAGSYLACQNLISKPKIFATEPLLANDTSISFKTGKIYNFEKAPKTIADGARTLQPSLAAFSYIKKLDGVYEITESEIIRWTQIISSSLKIFVEPTSALALAGCYQFLQTTKPITKPTILIILSGGNMSQETAQLVWKKNYL